MKRFGNDHGHKVLCIKLRKGGSEKSVEYLYNDLSVLMNKHPTATEQQDETNQKARLQIWNLDNDYEYLDSDYDRMIELMEIRDLLRYKTRTKN